MPASITRVRRLVTILLAHAGWRPESRSVLWPLAVVASIALATWIAAVGDPPLSLTYFALGWSFFYLGNTLALRGRARPRPRDAVTDARAWARYQILLGLMFANQGLALGAVCALDAAALPLPEVVRLTLGVALFAAGLFIKVWATDLVGVDTYFFRDLFEDRPTGTFVQRGPYRLFANPMYGPGYAHAYGLALLADSWLALAAAAACQLGIYAFYLIVERPFVRRVYGAATAPANATLPAVVQEAP